VSRRLGLKDSKQEGGSRPLNKKHSEKRMSNLLSKMRSGSSSSSASKSKKVNIK